MTLADRVEQANGPDRELDRLIVLAMAPASVERLPGLKPGGSQDGFVDREGVLPRGFAYTASLDAALTLMPEKTIRVEFGVYPDTGGRAWARIFADVEGIYSEGDDCETTILALLAAILRAHEQGGEGDE